MLILFAAVGCVLLIACVNVANLLLSRAAVRTREIAIREAIGASRGRIVRQLVTETVLLAFIGASAGLLMAAFLTGALVIRAPGAAAIIPPGSLPLDPLVFVFAFGLALVAGAAAGLFTAVQSARADLANHMRESTRSFTASRSRGRFRNILIVAELALSLVLLVSATLLLRSFYRLYHVTIGARLDHALTVGIKVPDPGGKQPAKVSAILREIGARVRILPGVVSAGAVSCLPVDGYCGDAVFSIEGHPLPPGQFLDGLSRSADPDYFHSAGIPLLRGRTFAEHDGIGFDPRHPRTGAIVISESLAKKFFAHHDPLGEFIVFDYGNQSGNPAPRYRIIGVVGDVVPTLDANIEPTYYLPLLEGDFTTVYIVLHTLVDPHSLIPTVRRQIHSVSPDIPLFHIRTMEEIVGQSASDRRFIMLLFSVFAGVAVLLAAVGLYGVLSYSILQRQSEIGIRLALGADVSRVRALILKQGMKPALGGIAAGMLGAPFATRAMNRLLFGVTPTDTMTFLFVPSVLLCATLLACYIPSVRATRIDPVTALRTE